MSARVNAITPSPGSTGEYRGVHVYKRSTTATDGDDYWGNIQDGKVYVYRAVDLEGTTPMPRKVFDTATGRLASLAIGVAVIVALATADDGIARDELTAATP